MDYDMDDGIKLKNKETIFDLHDSYIINWCGWWTTWDSLRKSGWGITIKPAYENWNRPADSKASRNKIYIRHPVNKMIGRIAFTGKEGSYDLDFLIQECNHRVKPLRVLEKGQAIAEDIPIMMEIILSLQEANKIKKKRKYDPIMEQQAEILLLRA